MPRTPPLRVHIDVTDTLSSGWHAGIQRVVCRLVDHLRSADPRLEVVPITWSVPLAGFRRLTPAELERLSDPAARAAAAPRSDDEAAPGALARVRRGALTALRTARHLVALGLAVTRTKELVRDLLRRLSLATVHRDHLALAVGEMPAGSVLFDLDTVWNQTAVDRDALYARVRRQGVKVAALVYDLLPLEHPEWFERSLVEVFDTALTAQARHADAVFAISRHSAESFRSWTRRRGIDAPEPVVVGMGADLLPSGAVAGGATPVDPALAERPYVLSVGTVEPRKNHALLLDVFDRLERRDPPVELDLVVVGRPGWSNEELVRRLERRVLDDRRVHWFRDADDDLLSSLYEHARVVAVPSFSEGFGLPVVEAFLHGVPVVASRAGALPEAGGDLAEYVDPADPDGWADALARHVEYPDHHRRRRDALVGYHPRSWRTAAVELAALLVGELGDDCTARPADPGG